MARRVDSRSHFMAYQKQEVQSKHFDAFKAALPSMAGKTVAITGTTSGTGRVAAFTVAEKGAKVVLLNRKSERSAEMAGALRASFPNANIVDIECDLMSFASVQAAADKVKQACPEGVHVLCNNAGIMAMKDEATGDGFDVQMQVNHLSHFLLTAELMPLLEKAAAESGDARIVNHSSVARMNPGKKLIGDYLEKKGGNLGGDGGGMLTGGARWVRYNQTKLANCAFTAALHERLQKKGSKVKALVAHPGLSNTSLQVTTSKDGGMGNLLTGWLMKLGQSEEDGTMGILSCMCVTDAKSGEFHGPGKGGFALKGKVEVWPLEAFYDNAETRDLLWSKSNDAIGKDFVI